MTLGPLSREDLTVGGLALVLAIFLFALPWFQFDVVLSSGLGVARASLTATDGPDGWPAIFAALAAIAIVADVGVERFVPQVIVPTIGGSRGSTRFVLACFAGGLTALKFLFQIHFSLFGWGFYVTILVAIALLLAAKAARDGRSLFPTGLRSR